MLPVWSITVRQFRSYHGSRLQLHASERSTSSKSTNDHYNVATARTAGAVGPLEPALPARQTPPLGVRMSASPGLARRALTRPTHASTLACQTCPVSSPAPAKHGSWQVHALAQGAFQVRLRGNHCSCTRCVSLYCCNFLTLTARRPRKHKPVCWKLAQKTAEKEARQRGSAWAAAPRDSGCSRDQGP